jgi:hypothetical protein
MFFSFVLSSFCYYCLFNSAMLNRNASKEEEEQGEKETEDRLKRKKKRCGR